MRSPPRIAYLILLPALCACGGAPAEALPGPCSAERSGLSSGDVVEVMTYEYRFDGRLIRRTGPGADDRIRFFYDGSSRLAIIDFPRGPEDEIALMLRHLYDSSGRLTSIERQLGSTGPVVERTRFEYGDSGRVQFREIEVPQAELESLRVDYRYDAAGRLVFEEPAIGPAVTYVYVEHGVLRHKDYASLRTIYELDGFGNVLGETVVSAHDETDVKQQWLYDYSCWSDRSPAERSTPRIETPYLSATVR